MHPPFYLDFGFFLRAFPPQERPVKPSVGVGVGKTAHIVWGGQVFCHYHCVRKKKKERGISLLFWFRVGISALLDSVS